MQLHLHLRNSMSMRLVLQGRESNHLNVLQLGIIRNDGPAIDFLLR